MWIIVRSFYVLSFSAIVVLGIISAALIYTNRLELRTNLDLFGVINDTETESTEVNDPEKSSTTPSPVDFTSTTESLDVTTTSISPGLATLPGIGDLDLDSTSNGTAKRVERQLSRFSTSLFIKEETASETKDSKSSPTTSTSLPIRVIMNSKDAAITTTTKRNTDNDFAVLIDLLRLLKNYPSKSQKF